VNGVTARGLGVLAATPVLITAGFRFGYPDLAAMGAAAGVASRCSATPTRTGWHAANRPG
jgi:hypothetical protein